MRWRIRKPISCGIEVHAEVILPDDDDGYCRMKIVQVGTARQTMAFVARRDWGRFSGPPALTRFLRTAGWVVDPA